MQSAVVDLCCLRLATHVRDPRLRQLGRPRMHAMLWLLFTWQIYPLDFVEL